MLLYHEGTVTFAVNHLASIDWLVVNEVQIICGFIRATIQPRLPFGTFATVSLRIKKLANVGSNAVQGQPSHLQAIVNDITNILMASDDVSTCVVIFWR